MKRSLAALALLAAVVSPAAAQTPVPEAMPFDIPYGEPVGLGQARQVADAALAEMARHNWKMAVAVVDPSGELVLFEKADGTQNGSVRIAQEKARTAAGFRRPTKALADAINGGSPATLSLGVVAVEGGLPLVQGGKLIGAVGASGGLSTQDGVVAKAGADTVK